MKRMFLVMISIIVQIAFYLIVLIRFTESFSIIYSIVTILSVIIVVGLISFSRNINSKMSWIVLIVLFPILGTLLYLLLGHNFYNSKILKKIKKSIEKSQKYLKQDKKVMDEIKEKDLDAYGQARYISSVGKYPIYKADDIKYYATGEEAYNEMLKELKKAEKFIFMEYFILSKGEMLEKIEKILIQKVKEGVDVRIIYDDIGSANNLPRNYYKKLEAEGIQCIAFNKLLPVIAVIMNNRDHRKITVIDGKVAFTGGINIADEYINKKKRFGYWKDNSIKFTGEAVWNFTMTFMEIWNAYREEKEDYKKFKYNFEEKEKNKNNGFICPYGENPLDYEEVGENMYINILNQAKNYVYIFTPYLIIDQEMVNSITLASKRGVDVRIVVPGIPDKKLVNSVTKSYYLPLVRYGVKIYEYTPGFIHSKVFVCDDKIATVGSQNLDYRSLFLHFECGLYMFDCPVIKNIKKDVLDTIDKSKLIEQKDIKISIPKFLKDGILRLFANFF